jgi:hypothetical protein
MAFCDELDCDRLVMDEKEKKCSKHRVNVGDAVSVTLVVGPEDELYGLSNGRVVEIDHERGMVYVNFGKKVGLDHAHLPSRFFRRDKDGNGWELKTEIR